MPAAGEAARWETPPSDRRVASREQTKAEIVAAAWELARQHGLAGLAMRDLGQRVGMKAQSLYSYFASKHEIYDAMFHAGYLEFSAEMADVLEDNAGLSGFETARRVAHRFFSFCTTDPVRYQLLFQRTIPDFVPSDESYAVALGVYRSTTDWFGDVGLAGPHAADLWTAVMTGLTSQQIANDPGGDRWARLVDQAVQMVIREIAPHLLDEAT